MDLTKLDDRQLLEGIRSLAKAERTATARFIAYMAEIDRRDMIAREGFRDLFDFCIRDLRLAGSTAYKRVQTAKVARLRPEVYKMLEAGLVTPATLSLISRHVRRRPGLVLEIAGKSKREVEALVAGLGLAQEEKPDRVRFVSTSEPPPKEDPLALFERPLEAPPEKREPSRHDTQPSIASSPKSEAQVPARVAFSFTASAELAGAVERLRALLWHKYPAGRLEDILKDAVEEYLERRDPARPRRNSPARPIQEGARTVPAAVRRAVWLRDGGQCAFEGPAGRCVEKRGLEVDHVTPFALGGRSDDPANLRLLCRAHNQWAARQAWRTGDQSRDLGASDPAPSATRRGSSAPCPRRRR